MTCVPSLLFLTAMFFVPESPRWLARHGAPDKAKAVLTSIGGESYSQAVYSEIESSIAAEHAEASLQTLFDPKIRRILWLGIFLAVLQQWCGINVIFNYAEEVFSAAGFPVSDILFNIVVTGAVNVLFTIIALRTVDRYGRRVLMLLGSAGLGIIYALLGLLYYLHGRGIVMLILVVAAIACFAMSLAPVTWVVIFRDFPQQDPGSSCFHCRHRSLERLLCAHLYLSFSKPRVGRIGNVLDIRGHLRSRFRLPALPPAGNEGKVAGSDRAVVGLMLELVRGRAEYPFGARKFAAQCRLGAHQS